MLYDLAINLLNNMNDNDISDYDASFSDPSFLTVLETWNTNSDKLLVSFRNYTDKTIFIVIKNPHDHHNMYVAHMFITFKYSVDSTLHNGMSRMEVLYGCDIPLDTQLVDGLLKMLDGIALKVL